MRLRPLLTLSLALAATLTAFGCASDTSTAPQKSAVAPPSAPSQSLLGGLLGTTTTTIIPLQRTAPLASNITTSKTIGVLGGTLAIPGAGLTVVVPPLAVGANTKFSVTALAGSNVAYEFAPHGIKFLVPLVMTQSLAGTNAQTGLLSTLSLGYFPDATHITSVTELLSVKVDLLNLTAVSTITHFSGYIYASGRE